MSLSLLEIGQGLVTQHEIRSHRHKQRQKKCDQGGQQEEFQEESIANRSHFFPNLL